MLGPVASSLRAALARGSVPAAPLRNYARTFASTSISMDRRVTFDMAGTSASLNVPSLSSILDRFTASFWAEKQDYRLALATPLDDSRLEGTPSGINEAEESDALQWDGLLHAVPKSRVSHSRKRMRSANKGLKDRTDFVHCPACGRPKLAHHICGHCYSLISREQKAAKRDLGAERAERQQVLPRGRYADVPDDMSPS